MDGGRQIVTLVVSAVLAMILGPGAFGVVAMATVYILLLEMLLRQGLVAAIVQRPELEARHLDASFWMTSTASLLLTLVSVVLSGWWASVNDTPQLAGIIQWLSLLLPLRALTIVQEAILRRRMEFKGLAVRTNIAELVGGGVGIAAAFSGMGIWALVAQQIARRASEVVVLWSISGWRPSPHFDRRAARELMGFSSGSFLGALAVFINTRADALLVGLFFGPVAVGLYRFALRFVDLVVDTTVRSLHAVALPELSRLQHDADAFRNRVESLAHISAAVALPALGVLAVGGDSLMRFIGPEWIPAGPALPILCIAGASRVAGLFIGPTLQSLGRPFLQASLSWLVAVMSAGTFTISGLVLADADVSSQVFWIAAFRASVYGLAVAGIAVWVFRSFAGLGVVRYLTVMAPPVAAALVAFATGRLVLLFLPDDPALLVGASAGSAAAMAAAITLWLVDPNLRRLAGPPLRVAARRLAAIRSRA